MDRFRGALTACALGLVVTAGPALARPVPGKVSASAAELAEVQRTSADELRRSAFEVWGLKPWGPLNACFAPLGLWSSLALAETGSAMPTSAEFHRFFDLSADDYRGAMLGQELELRRATRAGIVKSAVGVWLASDSSQNSIPKASPRGKSTTGARHKVKPPVIVEGSYRALVHALGGEVQTANFARPKETLEQINRWVMARTGAQFRFPRVESDPARASFILCSSMVFGSSWYQPFDRRRTAVRDFWVTPDRAIRLPTMTVNADFSCLLSSPGESNDFSLVELPYQIVEKQKLSRGKSREVVRPSDWAFDLILPDPKMPLESLEPLLTEERLSASLGQMRRRRLQLAMPSFQVRSQVRLDSVLSRLGLAPLFRSGASFPSIVTASLKPDQDSPFVGQVFQQVDVNVNEGPNTSRPPVAADGGAISLSADRPFLFVIRNVKSGNFLVMGRYCGVEGSFKR